ncbi:zeta toxin family protein [Apiospora marii]|uniref:Zeta toxin family protein n=1 Tax=Apiospora marii TaxID=335849 RepID=A0ABR1SAD6_9PEZI
MSTPSSDAITFVLSEQESTVIFEQNIIPAEFGGLEENVATLLPPSPPNMGQTGAGKTRAAPAIKKAFESVAIREEQEGPVLAHFVADTYKTYHPAYATLSAAEQRDHQPGRASAATGPDARRWLAMAARYAVALRADVLLESACRYPDDFASLAQTFHEGGYRVEVVLLAVPAGLSRLGTLTRFYRRRRPSEEAAGAESSPPRQQGALLQARLTPKKVHDASYEGLLYAAEFVDEASVVDQVVVVRRDNLVVYANEKEKGERGRNDNTGEQPGPGTADALRRERRRPLLEGERDAAADDLARLRSIERGPSSELWTQLADVEALLEPLLAETASVSGEEFPR